jgi:hypothetical protein
MMYGLDTTQHFVMKADLSGFMTFRAVILMTRHRFMVWVRLKPCHQLDKRKDKEKEVINDELLQNKVDPTLVIFAIGWSPYGWC